MANSQGQAQAALNEVNSKIAALTSQINALQSKIDKSLQSKAARMSDAEQDSIADQIDALKNQRGDLQEEAARLAEQANPGASDKKAADRQAERASMKQGWDDEVANSKAATKTGDPASRPKTAFSDSRTTSTEEVTGGGTTTTKSAPPTPAQEEYYRKYKEAQDADTAATNAANDEYLRSKGLESASPAQRRAALRDAREKGDLPPAKEPGTDFKEANPNPPPGMPSTVTTTEGENTKVTTESIEKTGASANNAGDKVTDAERPPIVNNRAGTSENAGTGKDVSANPTAEPLTAEEKKNLKNSNKSTEPSTDVVKPTKVGETEVTTTTTGKSATQAKEGTKKSAGDKPTTGPSTKKEDVIVKGGTDKSGDGVKTPARIKITPNPLHNYATYTYSISLHLLTPESYNNLSDGKDWLPDAKTLIAGGGRWSSDKANKKGFQRAAQFKDDFYFDGLTVESVIGLSQQGRGSNVYDFSFNIIEPYGFTLIDRLLELSVEMNQPNYLTNPYVIQIDFFGNNEAGDAVHPLTDAEGRSLTKYLPCKIIDMQIKVGASGAVYACRASPYNHAAFGETVAVAPANFEIVASTVGNFFTNDGDAADLAKQIEDRERDTRNNELNQAWAQWSATTNSSGKPTAQNATLASREPSAAEKAKLEEQAKKNAAASKAPFKAKSFAGAYNAYQQYLVSNQFTEHPMTVKFNIHPEIEKALIVEPEKTSPKDTPMVAKGDGSGSADSYKQWARAQKPSTTPVTGFDKKTQKFNINAGDQIIEIINKVMRSSTYITDQLKDDAQKDQDGNPLKWFKIIPKIKLTNFDVIRNDWASEITYSIIPYAYHNSKHPAMPISSDDEIRKNLRKKYSYIYTGENSDIIDFSVDFNTLFHTVVDVLTENSNRTNASQESLNKPIDEADNKDSKAAAKEQRNQTVQMNVVHPIAGDLSTQSGLNASGNPAAQRAANVMKSVYSNARGDMVNLKLKIVGDPDFIKTDDIYFNPANVNYPSEEDTHTPDGSIITDRGDIFCLVGWKSPADMNQDTGLADYSKFKNSVFDGVFKVIKVSSSFKSGGFEQDIELVRYHDAVTDVLGVEEAKLRDQGATAANKSKVIPKQDAKKDIKEGSTKNVENARASETNSNNTTPDDAKNKKLKDVADKGPEKTAEQQTADANSGKDNTVPKTSEAQPQSPQKDGGPPVKDEGGSQPHSANPPKIDNNNLPSGVTQDPDTGLYLYRGRRFSANDSADLAAKTKAIDDGTTVSTTKTDAESGQQKKVDFDGASPKPESKNADVAKLQQDYYNAQAAASTAQRRLDNANKGMFDDDPKKKQYVIDNNTKLLNDANAAMASLSEQLKAKGAAPREEVNVNDVWKN